MALNSQSPGFVTIMSTLLILWFANLSCVPMTYGAEVLFTMTSVKVAHEVVSKIVRLKVMGRGVLMSEVFRGREMLFSK